MRREQPIVADAAIQQVAPPTSDQQVVAGVAPEVFGGIGVTAQERVVSISSGLVVAPTASHQAVVTIAAPQVVGAANALQIVARNADQGVGAAAAHKLILRAVANEQVGVGAPGDVRDVEERVDTLAATDELGD